jgi:uncharacterized protein (UPF0332 family)
LPFAPVHFLNVASSLLKNAGLEEDEAYERTAVGRLYYAMFLQARSYLRQRGVRAATIGAVAGALEELSGAGSLGNELLRLHAYCNRCDYDDANAFPTDEVQRAVRLARRIESTLAALR